MFRLPALRALAAAYLLFLDDVEDGLTLDAGGELVRTREVTEPPTP